MKLRWILVAAVSAALLGCAPKEPEATGAGGAPEGPAAPGPRPGGGGGRMGGGFGMSAPPAPDPDAPLAPTPKEDQAVADAVKSGDKKAISRAYLERAVRHRIDDKAGAKAKYPSVLADIKKALDADPTNDRARKLERFVKSLMENSAKAAAAKEESGGKSGT